MNTDSVERESNDAVSTYRRAIRALRWALLGVAGLLALLLVAIAALFILSIPIDLSDSRQYLSGRLSIALDRPVYLEDSIIVIPALNPTLEVRKLRVGPPQGWPQSEFAMLDELRLQFALLPLLRREIRVDELVVDGLRLALQRNAAGEPNWSVTNTGTSSSSNADSPMPLIDLAGLVATDLDISYQDAGGGQSHVLRLERVAATAQQQRPVTLSVEGHFDGTAFSTRFSGGGLADLATTDKPWPVDVSMNALGADLSFIGDVLDPRQLAGVSGDIELEVPSTSAIKTKWELELPFLDKLFLKGKLQGGQRRLQLRDIEAAIDDKTFTAQIAADLSGKKPRFDGSIYSPNVDVGRLFETIRQGDYDSSAASGTDDVAGPARLAVSGPAAADLSNWEIDTPFLDTAWLQYFDARLELAIDEVDGAPTAIADLFLAIDNRDGALISPARVNIAGVPFAGNFSLVADGGLPSVQLSLTAEGSDIGDLARLLLKTEGIEGRFEQSSLDLSWQGNTLRDLVETSQLDFTVAAAVLSYGNESGDRPVEFTLARLDMNVLPEQQSRVLAKGALLGEPLTVEVLGGNFRDRFITGNWPVTIAARGGGARLDASGVFAGDAENRLAFELAGDRLGDLSAWLGIADSAAQSYRVEGELFESAETIGLRVTRGQVAGSRIRGEISVSGRRQKPLSRIEVHADLIDVEKLLDLFPASDEPAQTGLDMRYALDVPIMPTGLSLFDSDVDLSIAILRTRFIEAKDLGLSYRIRDGYVSDAPIRGSIAGTTLDGSLGIDLRSDNPQFRLMLDSGAFDVGSLLAQLGLVDAMDMTVDGLSLSLALEGSKLRQMLSRSRLVATVQGGQWQLNHFELSKELTINLVEARLVAFGKAPIAVELDGRIGETPLQLSLQADSLASFAEPKENITIKAAIDLAQAKIQLASLAPLPIRSDQIEFNLDVAGQRINDLDELLGLSLPPWGPYALHGDFGIDPTGYSINDLRLAMGQSRLTGDVKLAMDEFPPRLGVALAANSIQLDDFNTGDWSADGRPDPDDDTGATRARITDKLALLTPEFMNLLNAAVEIEVREVVSGEDRLGEGRLTATLENGRLAVDPLELGIPGGDVELAFELEPTETDIALRVDAWVDKLDYGYLARRIDPESSLTGLISVDTEFSTRGPDLDTVMHHANGKIDFAIWPQEINARLFDLWATNLLVFILPRLDRSADSRVNCVISRFRLEDGLMQPNVIFVDTTRVQASADGQVNFQDETLDFRIRPRPKRPEMFSAQTRLRVQGTLRDFSVGASAGAIAGSAIRIITSPIVVPFQWTVTQDISPDGEVECRDTWERQF